MREPRVWNYQELVQRRRRGRLLGWLAIAAFVLLAMVISRFLYLAGSTRVTIASGKTEGTVHQFLLSLADDSARRHHLDIEPVIATGTIDMLSQVDSGAVDFAIVHGGFGMDHYHNIRQIGVLSVGPVHLLIKQEHHAAVLEDLQNLRGRTISLGGGGEHTVMYWLSQEILAFVGLVPDYSPISNDPGPWRRPPRSDFQEPRMKPPSVPVDKVTLLEPVCLRITIPETYVDANGHMNMRWYVAIFDDAGDALHERIGLTREFHRRHASGTMDLEHHTSFLSEVLPGDIVAVYARMVAHSTKLAHYMMFMVNETHGRLAALFECVNAFVDLRARKTALYPPEIVREIAAVARHHNRLDWPPPVCGAMKL